MISLRAKDTNIVADFTIEQAEFLLGLPYSAFELADDNYEFKGNAIISRKNKKANSKAEKEGDD